MIWCWNAPALVMSALIFAQVASLGVSWAETDEANAGLPADRRLDGVRAALEVTMADAARAGLPVGPLIDKVREGLAKGVAPEAIRQAAARMVDKQIEARALVAAHRPEEPPFPLVRAVALAREGGISDRDLAPLIEELAPVPTGARAVEVVTALAGRGYEPAAAAAVVQAVALREPAAVGRVPAGIEAIRAAAGSVRGGQAAAVEALRRRLAQDLGSFETVVARTVEETGKAPAVRERRRRRRTRLGPHPAPASHASGEPPR